MTRNEKFAVDEPTPPETASVWACGVRVELADTVSDPTAEPEPTEALLTTPATVAPSTLTRVYEAPAATAPVPNWPVVSSRVRVELADTVTVFALVTLPICACTTLVSLITATAAP